jgi:hypothetical protein
VRQATLTLKSTAPVSKPDARDWSRELWAEAFAMARRMIRDRRDHGAGAAWDWYLRHARRRFTTPAAWRIAQAAGRTVFDRRTPMHATTGSVDELLRQGLVRRTRRPRPGNLLGVVPYRCATVDRVRALGLTFAWSTDPLASSANAGLRASRAQRLRQERAARRQVAAAMAQDRRDLERGTSYAPTPAGIAALRAATAVRVTA